MAKRKEKKENNQRKTIKEKPVEQKSAKEISKSEKLIALLKRRDYEVSALTKELNIDAHSLYDLAAELKKGGYDIRVSETGDKKAILTLARGEQVDSEAVPIGAINKKFKILFLSEVRMGAKQSQISLLHRIYKEAEEEDVDFAIVVGGLVVSKPTPTIMPDALKTDQDSLVEYVVKHFPKSKKFKTAVISGKAELSWKTKDGFDIVSAICTKREDLWMAGDLERTFDVKGIRIKAMSPFDDNCPKSVSYGPQGIADKLKENPMPDILVIGSTHRRSRIPTYNGMYIETIPSLHMQMRRQARRKVTPYVGCTILELNFKKDWSIDLGAGGLRSHMYRLDDYVNPNDCWGINLNSAESFSEEEKKVLDWFVKEHVISQGELSRRLKQSKESIEKIVKKLEKCGYSIPLKEDSKRYEFEVKEKENFSPLPLKSEELFVWATKEAGISDTHLGSDKDLSKIVAKAYADAAENGVRRVYNAGDVTDGAGCVGYKGHAFDARPGCQSLDGLEDYVVSKWPRFVKIKADAQKPPLLVTERIDWPEDGKIGYKESLLKEGETILQTDVIDGNHDGWAWKGMGVKLARGLAIRISQCFRYLGYLVGSAVVDGIYHKLVHPEGGSGISFSNVVERHLKKVRESKESGGLPTIVYIGHYHSAYLLFDTRLGIRMPCIKDEDTFHETHALLPFIGMFITEIYLDKSGKNITKIVSEYRDYYSQVKREAVKETHL